MNTTTAPTGKRAVIWFDGSATIVTLVASEQGATDLRTKISAAPGCEFREVAAVLNVTSAIAHLNPRTREWDGVDREGRI
jgi:hypothetical protein